MSYILPFKIFLRRFLNAVFGVVPRVCLYIIICDTTDVSLLLGRPKTLQKRLCGLTFIADINTVMQFCTMFSLNHFRKPL